MLDPNDIGDLPNDGRPPPFRPVQPPRPPGMEGNYGSGSDMEASPFGVSGMMNNPENRYGGPLALKHNTRKGSYGWVANRKQMLRMGMEYGQVYLKSRYFPCKTIVTFCACLVSSAIFVQSLECSGRH